MITCPRCYAALDLELPPDREQANNLVPEPALPSEGSVTCSDLVAAARTCETLANEIDVLLKTGGTETMTELYNLSDERHALQRAARALKTKAATGELCNGGPVARPGSD